MLWKPVSVNIILMHSGIYRVFQYALILCSLWQDCWQNISQVRYFYMCFSELENRCRDITTTVKYRKFSLLKFLCSNIEEGGLSMCQEKIRREYF